MQKDNLTPTKVEPEILITWSARKMQPIIIFYVALVFLGFMAAAHFIFHSMTGVKALAIGAVGYIVPLFASMMSKTEYQVTTSGLNSRPLNTKNPREFKNVFQWEQLSHIKPIQHGFKYYKQIIVSGAFRRFWKTCISDAFSGEVHVESKDRAAIMNILKERKIPLMKP
ncbi:hypothetical protein JW979_08005 [bacterium]|nr:hypothetical protein [candidate division CSSED10-310 bacterium]